MIYFFLTTFRFFFHVNICAVMNFNNSVTFFKVVSEELQMKFLRHELNERELDSLYKLNTILISIVWLQ